MRRFALIMAVCAMCSSGFALAAEGDGPDRNNDGIGRPVVVEEGVGSAGSGGGIMIPLILIAIIAAAAAG